MSRIKVLHLTKYHSPFNGGIENFLRDILQCNAIKKDCETRIIAHHHQRGVPTSHSTVDGVPVTRVKLWRQVLYAPICLNLPAEMNRILTDFKPDVLHIHMPNLSAFYCLFSRDARRCRWILHWHSDVLGECPRLARETLAIPPTAYLRNGCFPKHTRLFARHRTTSTPVSPS